MPARRRTRLLIALAAFAVALALLALGAWIGGRHPDAVPGPLRSQLTGSEDRRVVNEALDLIESTYYRKIPRSQIADDAIAGAVAKLRDRFSNYFTPEQYQRFQDEQNSRFTGVGVSVAADPQGLRVMRVFDGSPAERGGDQGGRRVHRRRRQDARGGQQRRRELAGQGAGGDRRSASPSSATAGPGP